MAQNPASKAQFSADQKGGSIRLPVYDPSLPEFAVTEVVSSGDRLSLQPHQFQLKQNIRQQSKVWEARGSDVVIASSVPTDATARADGLTAPFHAQDVQLNGTWYHVSAWNTANGTAVYYLNLSAGTYTEITSKGDPTNRTSFGGDGNGKTRMATATTDVTFTVATTPRRLIAGVEQPPRDVLIVQNGEDYPVIWDPGQTTSPFSSDPLRVFRHLPINPPQGALTFRQTSTFSAFAQIAGSTGTNTYSATNARYEIIESVAAPYASGSNYCAKFLATVLAATGDSTKLTLATTASFAGEQISFIAEGTSASVSDLFTNCLLELSSDNSTYYTIYDASSTDTAIAAAPFINGMDAGTGATARWLVTYSLRNAIPTWLGQVKYIRVTRKNGAPAAAYSVIILGVVGDGPGGGFGGGTIWTIAYADAYTQAETGQITASSLGWDLLANMGGPSVVTSGSGSTAGFRVPEFSGPQILYDYRLHIVGAQGAQTINGGLQQTLNSVLQAVPQCVDLYFQTFADGQIGTPATHWQRINLYTAQTSGSNHRWNCVFNNAGTPTPVITIATQSYGFGVSNGNLTDRFLRDPGVAAPSAFNITMPRAGACISANGRTFIGNVKTPSGNYARGDIYFSRKNFPFRYTSITDSFADGSVDEASGSRVVLTGQIVRGFSTSSAAYAGSSKVFIHTDQEFGTLGHASPFYVSTLTSASELSLYERISSDGTNEYRSVAEFNGLLMWWNQHGVLTKYAAGQATPVSYLKFDDISGNLPAARRGYMSAAIQNFRYKCAYTPSVAPTGNFRILIWNTITEALESLDTMAPQVGSAERLVRTYDSSVVGSGQRLLAYGYDGKVYAMEEGTAKVPVAWVSREITGKQIKLPAGQGFYVDTVEMACDTEAGESAVISVTPDYGGGYAFTLALDSQSGSLQWIQQQNPGSTASSSETVYLTYAANHTPGKKIREVWVELATSSADNRLESS